MDLEDDKPALKEHLPPKLSNLVRVQIRNLLLGPAFGPRAVRNGNPLFENFGVRYLSVCPMKASSLFQRLGLLASLAVSLPGPLKAAPPLASPRVDVILWFDTEDYLLPASDDSAKRLAGMLTERGIHATFKVVGEKARTLERRGRLDVIAALRQHAIGYHANFHSVHPTPTEYLADCDLLDGMSEFARREGGGAADVRRIFNVPTLACYGQPGSSWAPEAIASLGQIGVAPHGVPCYVDEGDHIGLNEQPFWYCGALIVYHMGENWTRMELHDPGAVEPAEQKFSAIADRLRASGGGLISIFYHPCEWMHEEFWDGVNFRRGANPPREQWRPPLQRPAADTEAAFQRFGQYLDYMKAVPGVRFVTANDLPLIYPDPVRTGGASAAELVSICESLLNNEKGVDFRVIDHRAFSAADQFAVLTDAVGQMIDGKGLVFPVACPGLLGPDQPPHATESLAQVSWPAFRDAALNVRDCLRVEKRVPAEVFIGADKVAPADFLTALAWVFRYEHQNKRLPAEENIPLSHGRALLPASHVAADTPGLFGGWIIHKEGFRAPHVLDVARLQTWTLKPALRGD